MINGNINEFIDKLRFGEELIFIYNERKFFLRDTVLIMDGIALSYSNVSLKEKCFGM